jgi:hypothetical protein
MVSLGKRTSVTESLPHLHEPENSFPAVDRPGRRRWQIGLRTCFLLMAAIAVWMAYFINRRDIASLEPRVRRMVPLTHELVVKNPKQIAAVKLDERWFDETRWEIFLPDGEYRLCLATRGITGTGLTPESKSVPITAGRHQLSLEQQLDNEVWRVTTLWDEAKLIAIEEPKDWGEISGYRGQILGNKQLSPDQPLILYRRRFKNATENSPLTDSSPPTDGILLWIERS